jgi:hypothetical protein
VEPTAVLRHEVLLHDGDLVVMGGHCQETHKHEVPPPPKSDVQRLKQKQQHTDGDDVNGCRINVTLRCAY